MVDSIKQKYGPKYNRSDSLFNEFREEKVIVNKMYCKKFKTEYIY